MFETVGKARKVNRRRQAGSLSMALLMLATAGSSVLIAGTQLVEEINEEQPIEVTFLDEAPPPPPPPPPPAAEEEEEEEEEDDDEVEEDEPEEPDDVIELPKEVPPEKPKKAKKGGVVGGVEGGVEGGVVGGVMGGVLGGVLGGQLGGTGVKAVHWSEVKAKKQVQPRMPDAAKTMNIEGDCRLRLFIDEKGNPYDIKVEACPKVFEQSALEAAWKWEFYPMEDQGKPVRSQFTIKITFKLH